MRNNWLKYTVVAALLMNAATLIFFWVNRPPQGGRLPVRPAQMLTEALKLTGNQQEMYQKLRAQHHEAHDSLLKIIAAKRQVLYNQKQTPNDTILQQIGFLQSDIERITYNHFNDVRKVCTPEQQAQLDSLLVKTVQNILMPNGKRQPFDKRR